MLHFWQFIAQIYVPAVINNEGKRDFVGYALAIPDVAELKPFCEDFPQMMRERGLELSGYRPRDCVVDLAVESALDLMRRLQERLAVKEGEKNTNDLILGVDVVHLEKQGNNVRLWSSSRLDPDQSMIDAYANWRGRLWDATFRRQRLLNLIKVVGANRENGDIKPAEKAKTTAGDLIGMTALMPYSASCLMSRQLTRRTFATMRVSLSLNSFPPITQTRRAL